MSPYRLLAERIRGEIPDLDLVIERILAGWSKACQTPQDDLYLDAVALNLHGFYSGIERLFELIAQRVDHHLPVSQTWHRDLLWLMTQDLAGVRPAIIGQDKALALDELRRFRHLVRNVYTMKLMPEKMINLVVNLPALWLSLRAELLAFASFLEDLAQAHER